MEYSFFSIWILFSFGTYIMSKDSHSYTNGVSFHPTSCAGNACKSKQQICCFYWKVAFWQRKPVREARPRQPLRECPSARARPQTPVRHLRWSLVFWWGLLGSLCGNPSCSQTTPKTEPQKRPWALKRTQESRVHLVVFGFGSRLAGERELTRLQHMATTVAIHICSTLYDRWW